MRTIHCVILIAAVVASSFADAQYSDGTVKIGVLTDMSGIYSDIGGPGSIIAAKLAVEDFRPAVKAMKVEVVSCDMQNKPDVGISIANTWFDVDKVDVIIDGMNSGVSLAVSEVTRQKNKLFLVTGEAFRPDARSSARGARREGRTWSATHDVRPATFSWRQWTLFADYIIFAHFQWARVMSPLEILCPDDVVAHWFQRCLDLHFGMGREMPSASAG
jgi:hypothetical protein